MTGATQTDDLLLRWLATVTAEQARTHASSWFVPSGTTVIVRGGQEERTRDDLAALGAVPTRARPSTAAVAASPRPGVYSRRDRIDATMKGFDTLARCVAPWTPAPRSGRRPGPTRS